VDELAHGRLSFRTLKYVCLIDGSWVGFVDEKLAGVMGPEAI
jgi:hypothetical protein